jgi:putative membrane protein
MVAVAAVAVLGVTACGRDTDSDADAAPPSATLEAPAAPVDAPLQPENIAAGFTARAALNDMYEIESGRMALEKSQDNDVRRFAQMMLDDHTRTSNEGRAVIAQQGVQVTLPSRLDEPRRALIAELEAAAPEAFDARYIDQQIQAHEAALGLMQTYARAGDNEAVRAWATRTAPAIENHLQMARGLKRTPTPAPGADAATNNAGAQRR